MGRPTALAGTEYRLSSKRNRQVPATEAVTAAKLPKRAGLGTRLGRAVSNASQMVWSPTPDAGASWHRPNS